jgi:hypothetical protein
MAILGAAGASSEKVTMAGEDSEIVAWILPEVIYPLAACLLVITQGIAHHILQLGHDLLGSLQSSCRHLRYKLIDSQATVQSSNLAYLALQYGADDLLH